MKVTSMILAGDIGGTKTVLALFESHDDKLQLAREGTFSSRRYASFDDILAEFLKQQPQATIHAGCFGVAGAVIDGKCHTTNLPWNLDEKDLAPVINSPQAKLLNDLEAAAYGMLYLKQDELCALNPDARKSLKGNVAVIAAGTGLGEAILYWNGKRYHPLASEGGHCDFAPRNEQEIELLRYLQKKLGGHVSYERILSGPGFSNVYSFLRDSGFASESPEIAKQMKAGDANAVIGQHGLAGTDKLSAETLRLVVTIYGAEAGNLALKCVAVGGVFIGGGISPKILPAFQTGAFMKGFTEKGRFGELLKSMPVNVALNARAPLLGAAHYAAEMN
ncbi:MAG TPA: glucokinase [Gemmataceae bacterium]|nr:glucokinase [Gemmataceae bacterium]